MSGRPAGARRRSRRPCRGLLPNVPEAAAAFLACASIGAIWTACSPRVRARQRCRPLRPGGAEGALLRRRLPLRRTRRPPRRGRRRAASRAPCSARRSCCPTSSRARPAPGALTWTEFLCPQPLVFEQLPFDAPAVGSYYSSGTTGLPEGDRPRSGRDSPRAPRTAAFPCRRASLRPAVLVHDHRLDDVEPTSSEGSSLTRRSCCSTAARPPRTARRCGSSLRRRE